jgi:hypothetical protein
MNSRSWARRLAGAAGAALALAATTVAIDAAPAAAIDAGGPVVVDRSTGWDSAPYKPMDAFCPDNTELIGTGATGAGANTIVEDLIPYADHVHGFLYEDGNGTNADSELTVRAICADVVGYEINVAESLNDGYTPKSAVARCSTSTKDLLGTGYAISGGFGEVTVTAVVPYAATTPTADSVTVTANEDDDYSTGTWKVTAYAICGTLPYETVVQSSDTTSNSNTTQGKSQTCPSDRYNTGGGTYMLSNARDLHPSPFMPAGYYNGVDLVNGSAYEDDDGTANNWNMRLYAVCVIL